MGKKGGRVAAWMDVGSSVDRESLRELGLSDRMLLDE